MLASGATDVAVAIIIGVAGMAGAGLGLLGVVLTVRSQKRPRLLSIADGDPVEREKGLRLRAEAERDAWRDIALQARRDLTD